MNQILYLFTFLRAIYYTSRAIEGRTLIERMETTEQPPVPPASIGNLAVFSAPVNFYPFRKFIHHAITGEELEEEEIPNPEPQPTFADMLRESVKKLRDPLTFADLYRHPQSKSQQLKIAYKPPDKLNLN